MRCNVLIVIRHQETLEQMAGILSARGCHITETCSSGMHGLRAAGTHCPDIAVVGYNLTDMTGVAFAEDLAGLCDASVLLVVPPEQVQDVRQRAVDLDLSILPRPITAQGLAASIDMLLQFRERYHRMQAESQKLKAGLERRGLAEKAKLALMKSLGLSEAEAWRHIQKQSMDTGRPLEQVSRHILDIHSPGP